MGGFGRLIGGVVGAVVGIVLAPFSGGMSLWSLAAWGFTIGSMVGGFLDPSQSNVGAPAKQALSFTVNEIGIPIPDLLGTSKITGIFLCYGKERSKAIKSKSGGKGGGGGSTTTGYKYYMSWVQAICFGPVDTLYAIYSDNDTLLWSGELNCPVSGGKETITISKGEDLTGRIDFYFGTPDHAVNTKIGEIIGDATLNSPLRGLCYAFFDDCYMGTSNRCPSVHFVIRKAPVISALPTGVVSGFDYNPANAIWYILHNLTGLPESWLHTANFITMSNLLLAEGRGLSILFDQQQGAINYLQTINIHVDSIIQYGSDGKFHPKLLRDDYTVGSLPLVDETAFLDDPALSRAGWIDTVNEIKVQYSQITNATREVIVSPCFADACIQKIDPTKNMGASTYMMVGCRPYVNWWARTLVSFLKSDVEAEVVDIINIVGVYLELYRFQGIVASGHTMEVNRLTRDFEEGTGDNAASGDGATWDTYDGTNNWSSPGGDYSSTNSVQADHPTENGYVSWDVTDQWTYLVANSLAKLLFLIKDSNESELVESGTYLLTKEATPLPPPDTRLPRLRILVKET